ncbi:MAG: type II toxin-antitoxin system prevent-host-death family antitoxin [Chloroflexota bacterium]|nr:type II toxin-antitoxin system prevent-host-death family antitoxin [Chloroflexota bacterium]
MVTESGGGARTMKASEFKARCLALMDEVAESGEEIVITKHGKPVAKLAPCEVQSISWFGRDRDGIVMYDDLIEPVGVEWEAETDPDRVLNP